MDRPVTSCSDGAMPRPRPPHLHRETSRHGRTVWYVRIGHGPRIRLPVGPGGEGFDAAYRGAIAGETPAADPRKPHPGSIAWLIARYMETGDWRSLSVETRKQRGAIFAKIVETAGREPFSAVTRAHVVAGRDRRSDTPSAARHYLDCMRRLFRWALSADLISIDPTEGVRAIKVRDGDGFEVWSDVDVARFEKRWPLGTRARVAFDLLRYTGLRRGDAARLGRPHVKAGVISIKTEKTGEWVTIRMVPELAASIAAGPIGDLTYITGKGGQPLTKESFGNQFREWCREAKVDKSAHGLRKLAATTMAEAGATVAELESVFGWSGGRMASHYTRSADRKRLGLAASSKLSGTSDEHSIPSPKSEVRD